MTEELFIPQLGQTVEEVILINWLVDDGAKVDVGAPVLEVETDKAIFTVEANARGFLHKGPQKIGESVPVLTVVATIGESETQTSPASSALQGNAERRFISPRARQLARSKHIDISNITPSGGGGVRVIEKDVINYLSQIPKATPVAAAMAEKEGVNLAGVVGSGQRGIVTKSDIEKAIQEKGSALQKPTPAAASESDVLNRIPLIGARRVIFEKMSLSVHTTVRVTLVSEMDATEFSAFREQLKENVSEAWGFTPGYNDVIGIIVAKCLKEFPYMNARISADEKSIEWLERVNLGVAVDADHGLTVPVIPDADKKSIREFGTLLRQFTERARAGRSLPEDLSYGTFTITNLGNHDIDAFTPVINIPEAAILGIGRIQDKVAPINGEIKIRKMLTLSLVFDHRIIDGAPAARFLQRIKQYIEKPLLLVG